MTWTDPCPRFYQPCRVGSVTIVPVETQRRVASPGTPCLHAGPMPSSPSHDSARAGPRMDFRTWKGEDNGFIPANSLGSGMESFYLPCTVRLQRPIEPALKALAEPVLKHLGSAPLRAFLQLPLVVPHKSHSLTWTHGLSPSRRFICIYCSRGRALWRLAYLQRSCG